MTLWNKLRLTGGGRWLIGQAVIFAALFVLCDSIMLNAAKTTAYTGLLGVVEISIVLGSVIVRTNAGRMEAANPFDASHAVSLSANAMPALIASPPTLPPDDQCVTAARILARWSPPQCFDTLAWNLDRSLARWAVGANWSYLQSMACSNTPD